MKNDDENNVDEFLVSLRNDLEVLRDEIDATVQRVEMAIKTKPRLLDVANASAFLNLSAGYLANLRRSNKGPKYIKFKGFVRYDIRDLEKWVDTCQRH